MRRQGHWSVAAVVLALAGCAQPEDRINAALPVGADILDAHARLVATAQAQRVDVTSIEQDYAQRLRLRGRECGHGYTPGPFTGEATIREALTDAECFAARDAQLRRWLEWRRVGLLLAAPPLRPVPKSAPPAIVATSAIRQAEFAARAGVALVQTIEGYQVIDLGTGATVHRGSDGDRPQAISPNGAVFLTQSLEGLQLRAAANGEVLATLPGVPAGAFHWLGDAGAVFSRPLPGGRRTGPMLFVDFASGQETPIPTAAAQVKRVVPIPDEPARHVLVSDARMGEIELRRDRLGLRAVLLSERVLSAAGFAHRDMPVTDDGRHLVGLGSGLQVLDVATLKLASIALTPFRPDAVVLTPEAGLLLLTGRFPDAGFRGERYLYSTTRQTLARVDDGRLPFERVLYIPSLRRNAVIDDRTIAMLGAIPAGPPIAAETLLNERGAMAFALAREHALKMPEVARARLQRSRELDALSQASAGATNAGATGAARP